jgi:sulfopropanediol 3-dehydrogenase
MEPSVAASSAFLIEQVRGFARLQRDTLVDFEAETLPGVLLGQKWIPIGSVGAYSPGGAYPLIASAVMTVATAKVAEVPRVLAAARPGTASGCIHPSSGRWSSPAPTRSSASAVSRRWPAWHSVSRMPTPST